MHRDFNTKTYENDVAMLKLTRQLEFNEHVGAVSLAEPEQIFDGMCTAIGWGRTSHSNILFNA